MTIITPERSIEQRHAALLTANRIRVARAHLKRALKPDRSLARPIGLILDPFIAPDLIPAEVAAVAPADFADAMRIADVLDHCAGVAKVKRNRILQRTQVSPSRTLGGITIRQRQALVAELTVMRQARFYGASLEANR